MNENNESSVAAMEAVKEEEKGQNQAKKRIKIVKEEKIDRISALPDCLLVEILSHLPSTKYAIITGTLSKRWKHVWTFVHTLIFNRENNYVHGLFYFFSFIDKTLTQLGQSKLKKLELDTRYEIQFQSQVNNLIRYAISCNVEDLNIRLWKMYYCDLADNFMVDQYFFVNSCINHLTLGGCVLNPSGAISWKTLRSLYIKQGKLDEDLIENILFGSPLLETLKLEYCFGYERLDITSKSVKNLVISGYMVPHFGDHVDYENVEINAPNILSLVIDEELALWKLSLLDVSSLVEVDLDYIVKKPYADLKEDVLKDIVLTLCHVPEVKIGMSCFGAFSRLEARGAIRPSNLKVYDGTPPLSSDDDLQ